MHGSVIRHAAVPKRERFLYENYAAPVCSSAKRDTNFELEIFRLTGRDLKCNVCVFENATCIFLLNNLFQSLTLNVLAFLVF
jgi:hypothetical protein